MQCLFCRKGPEHGVALFRVNAKGRPGVYACDEHLSQTDAQVAPELRRVSEILKGRE